MRPSARLAAVTFVAALSVLACKKAPVHSHLQEKDMEEPPPPAFDPNDVVARAVLEDNTVDRTTLYALITNRRDKEIPKELHNPYDRDSFLVQYASNGYSALEALRRAADVYSINPIVLLVRTEMAQGLVGLDNYPAEAPSRVEYLFECGCTAPGVCDERLAGFDRQIDCLAREYRALLDDFDERGGVTAGGWKAGAPGVTLDGQTVTPKDEGTAIAYQMDPRVGDRESGNRLFWTVLRLYTGSIHYTPSRGTARVRAVGDACASKGQCGFPDPVCVLSYPNGMCTKQCNVDTDCPERSGQPSYCVETQKANPSSSVPPNKYCFARCDPNAGGSCRNGYGCCSVLVSGGPDAGGASIPVCKPLNSGDTCSN